MCSEPPPAALSDTAFYAAATHAVLFKKAERSAAWHQCFLNSLDYLDMFF
jgi:hypothetical protein